MTEAELAAILRQPGYAVLDESPLAVNMDRELEENGRQVVIKQESGRRNKYNAIKTIIGDITFDSKREAERYLELQAMEWSGQIYNLERQPVYELIVNGVKVGEYHGDFKYVDSEGNTVTEDVKSKVTKTATYRLKKKLVKAIYGVEIKEVE